MGYLWQFYLLIGVIILQGVILIKNVIYRKDIFVFLCFVELVFLSGFRAWDIGNDTLNYIGMFIDISNSYHLGMIISHMENGYLLYNKFLSLITYNPQIILIANGLIIIYSILSFIKRYSSGIFLSILLFVVLNFDSTLNIMREYLALSIILMSFPFVIKRRFFAFAVCCVVATTFHTTAISAIGLYFIYPLNFKFRHLVWITISALIGFVFFALIIDQIITITGRYSGYKGNILLGEEIKIASVMKTLIQFTITAFCLFSYKYVYNKKSNYRAPLPISFLLFCSVVATCLQFISIRGTVLERLVLYFSIFNLISVPFFINCYPRKMRLLGAVCILGSFIIYHSVIFVYRPEWNYVLPFKFCF